MKLTLISLMAWLCSTVIMAPDENDKVAFGQYATLVQQTITSRMGSEFSEFQTSNERNDELFDPVLKANQGGAFVAIGAEQSYNMAAVGNPQIMILIDYNPKISLLHLVYRSAFLRASTPEAWLDLFKKEARARLESFVLRDCRGLGLDAELKSVMQTFYDQPHWAVSTIIEQPFYDSLLRVAKRARRVAPNNPDDERTELVPTFLNEKKYFDSVRSMYAEDRVLILSGDIANTDLWRQIDEIALSKNVQVKNIYVSNAHQRRYQQQGVGRFVQGVTSLRGNPLLLTTRRPETMILDFYTPNDPQVEEVMGRKWSSVRELGEGIGGMLSWDYCAVPVKDLAEEYTRSANQTKAYVEKMKQDKTKKIPEEAIKQIELAICVGL